MFNCILDGFPEDYMGYPIRSDFRIGIKLTLLTEDNTIDDFIKQKFALTLLYKEPNKIKDIGVALDGLVWFLTCGNSEIYYDDDYTYDFTNFKSMLSSEGLPFVKFVYDHIMSSFSLSDMCFYLCNYDWIAKFNVSSNTYNFARLQERPKKYPLVFRYTDIPFCLVNNSYNSTYPISSSTSRVVNNDLSLGAYGVALPDSTYISSDSSFTAIKTTKTFTHSDDYSYHFLGGYAYPNACYLATINNQSDVLTKTPDKTMKIIYTLYEE